jgi:hypothetical protein
MTDPDTLFMAALAIGFWLLVIRWASRRIANASADDPNPDIPGLLAASRKRPGRGRDQSPSATSRLFLWAIFPIGIALTIIWLVWLIVAIAVGDTQRGFSIASAALGLVTSVTLIVSGRYYRRALHSE